MLTTLKLTYITIKSRLPLGTVPESRNEGINLHQTTKIQVVVEMTEKIYTKLLQKFHSIFFLLRIYTYFTSAGIIEILIYLPQVNCYYFQ